VKPMTQLAQDARNEAGSYLFFCLLIAATFLI
jgi:hypothetical protein